MKIVNSELRTPQKVGSIQAPTKELNLKSQQIKKEFPSELEELFGIKWILYGSSLVILGLTFSSKIVRLGLKFDNVTKKFIYP